MKFPRRLFFQLSACAALASTFFLCLDQDAWSQTPRTIRIIVPFAPGGGGSVLARVLADGIKDRHNVTIVVENRPGGGSVIATQAVSVANPDGNTLLITTPAHLINPHLRKQNYDPFGSFEPICRLVDLPNFLAVNGESPYRSVNDLVTAARTTPGQLTVATFTATAAHIALEDFKRRANIDLTFVPYPGGGPAVTALLGGHVTAMIDNYATMAEHVKAGKLRVLATFAPARIKGLEDIPTFAESGYNQYEGWFGLFAPANVPKATASELIEWTTEAMGMPDVRRKLEPLGLFPVKMCGADFAGLLHKQSDEFGRIIREANIKAE